MCLSVSLFVVDDLFFTLRQSVHDVVTDGQRRGSVLVQRYHVTNVREEPRDFDLTRYFDCDLALSDTVEQDADVYLVIRDGEGTGIACPG